MKIVELINRLQKMEQDHGNIPVYLTHEISSGVEEVNFFPETTVYREWRNIRDHFPDRVEIS